jgi:hypothetical protein
MRMCRRFDHSEEATHMIVGNRPFECDQVGKVSCFSQQVESEANRQYGNNCKER